ncbi:hypothetical protein [Nocardia nova]|uniref:hypothetical protein n=1 Tax=Nocardia nova TaxID=37330 RepID=UPI0033F7F624
MPHYLVKVHCCGPNWLIHVPALELWTMANDRRKVTPTAQAMVADATQTRLDEVQLDMAAGRVLGSVGEFTMAESFAQRWVQSEFRAGARPVPAP